MCHNLGLKSKYIPVSVLKALSLEEETDTQLCLQSKVVGMVGVMYTKITRAQKRVTIKDWWWLLPWKILDEGKCDLLLGRMNRCLQGKSRG